MKEGWVLKKISEVCLVTDYVANGSFQSLSENVKYNYENDYAILLRTTDFSKKWSKNFVYVSEDSYNFLNKSNLKIDDVVISNVGATGITFKVPDLGQPMTLGPNAILVRSLNFEKLTQNYIYYLFLSPFGQGLIQEITTGTTQSKFNKTNFREQIIPIPSLSEQQRIVSILDEAFTAIDQAKENLQRNLQNAKELFQSELNSIFSNKGYGWEERTLNEIALTFGRGKSKHRPRNDAKLYGGVYPFIQTGDVRNADKFIIQYTQSYNETGLAQSKLWGKGTICITIAANIAETGILTFDSCFPDSMIGLIVDPRKADVNFTYYALQFLKTKLQLLGKGSAQDNINLGTFESQTFPFPSLEVQHQIVHQLDTLSAETKKLESIYQQKLNSLEELKKSILQKAFSGELIPKNEIFV